MANFARAFQQAGAHSVVVSLWPLVDHQGMEFMKVFYGHRQAGKTRREALRLTRREIKTKYPHPYYWGYSSCMARGERLHK